MIDLKISSCPSFAKRSRSRPRNVITAPKATTHKNRLINFRFATGLPEVAIFRQNGDLAVASKLSLRSKNQDHFYTKNF